MKLFLSVFYADYAQDVDAFKKKSGKLIDPDVLTLERLRQFFLKKGLWSSEWDTYVRRVQSRRNAIHAFKNTGLLPGSKTLSSVYA